MIGVLKIGGGAGIDAAPALENVAERVRSGERWVIVHGASAAADALAARAGVPVETLVGADGHTSRYTPPAMIDLYCAAAASVNQTLVSALAECGAQPVGLAGPNVIAARRKSAIRARRNGRPVVVRDDQTGTITGVEADLIERLVDAGYTPVVAPVALSEQYERLNVDGDLVAATLAAQLNAETLLILSNVPGLLRDLDDPRSLIGAIPQHALDAHAALAQGRMKKKLLAARIAHTAHIILATADRARPVDDALSGGGTHILPEEVAHAAHAG
ncbi:MAG: [LysW]-aminoadipate kinase [Chloroflexi bacterium]|nr:[LysW]-aminoadipate kinase [Chloroflexota bacterium]